MEYLYDITDKLIQIDEKEIIYYDLFNLPELFYGNLNIASEKVVFSKFPRNIIEEVAAVDKDICDMLNRLNDGCCGYRIKFKTSSKKFILKIRIEYLYENKSNGRELFNSFDIYSMKNDSYVLLNSLTPENDEKIFAECISNIENKDICIFLPNNVKIKDMYIGIESGQYLTTSPYLGKNRLPILFFGNENSQGKYCLRSSDSYPNILSKMLDNDIINISCDKGSIPIKKIGEYLGQFNCKIIILDCAENDYSKEFNEFYEKIREYNKNKLIILLTTDKAEYLENNKIIEKTYEKAKNKNEPTAIINKNMINDNTEKDNYELYDKLMYKIAEDVLHYLKK